MRRKKLPVDAVLAHWKKCFREDTEKFPRVYTPHIITTPAPPEKGQNVRKKSKPRTRRRPLATLTLETEVEQLHDGREFRRYNLWGPLGGAYHLCPNWRRAIEKILGCRFPRRAGWATIDIVAPAKTRRPWARSGTPR